MAFFLGIICSVGGVLLTPWLLRIMSVPEEVQAGSLIYCRIYFAGLWAMILYNMMAGILRAFGDSKKPLYVLVICAVVNVVGDLLLVGAFHMGVGGAAGGNGALTGGQRDCDVDSSDEGRFSGRKHFD